MMAAIRAAGLDPEAYEPITPAYVIRPLSSLIYAYSRGGLPVVLVIQIEGAGAHAITIAGFSLQSARVHASEVPDALIPTDAAGNPFVDATGQPKQFNVPPVAPMRGLRINEFYAHDDGHGPFSRLIVQQPLAGAHKVNDSSWRTRFVGQWKDANGNSQVMMPTCVIVPVYEKIRLDFGAVQTWISRLHPGFHASGLPGEREWMLYYRNQELQSRRKCDGSP